MAPGNCPWFVVTAMITYVLFHGSHAMDEGAVVREVELPCGYYRVWDGAFKPGDLYLDMMAGGVVWKPVKMPTRRETKDDAAYSSVKWYGCIVRVGEPVMDACPRCKCAPRMLTNKFCRVCCRQVILNRRVFSNED
jgi:hypothetical protein